MADFNMKLPPQFDTELIKHRMNAWMTEVNKGAPELDLKALSTVPALVAQRYVDLAKFGLGARGEPPSRLEIDDLDVGSPCVDGYKVASM